MTTPYDVPPDKLIEKTAKKLAENKEITPPTWSEAVKTGRHREKVPTQKDWWFIRLAAILRKIYLKGPIGTERLASEFGGKRDRGSKPYHAVKGSRSIVRKGLQQLEKVGLVDTLKGRGRQISPSGQSFLDNVSNEVKKEVSAQITGLKKY
ncbi:MAG TPA: 30S ribosomal protein S19e [Thermoplasmata archaeon]|jgi:small subunit ribosomal protein S19e|nr:30S ribosomal protein S19e [Thermoplasmata archaeon]